MKLIIAIVNDDDAENLNDELTDNNFGVTKLATTGGFLKAGNTTFIIGVEKEKVNDVVDIIESNCKERNEIVTTPGPVTGNMDIYMQYPVEVKVGGATVFVLDIDQFVKL